MTKKYETVVILDTGKYVRSLEDEYHPEWHRSDVPNTTYIKFQELVEESNHE